MVSVKCFVKLPLHLNEVGEEDPAYRRENEFIKRNTFTVFSILDKSIPDGSPVMSLAVYETHQGERYGGGLAANWKLTVCNLYARVLFDMISDYHRKRMVKEWLEDCVELASWKITEIKPASSQQSPKQKRYFFISNHHFRNHFRHINPANILPNRLRTRRGRKV